MIEEIVFDDLKWQDDYTIYIHPDEPNLSEYKKKEYIKIAQLQRYYQKNPIRFVEEWFQITMIDAQKVAFQIAWTTPNVLLNCTRGLGKALDLDTPILTPEGFRKLKDIQTGQLVYGADGKPVKVLAVSEDVIGETYEITFEDEDRIVCHGEHEWLVEDGKQRRIMETAEMAEALPGRRLNVAMNKPIEFPFRETELDPYIAGLFLGNRNVHDNTITVFKRDVDYLVNRIRSLGYIVYVSKTDRNRWKHLTIYKEDGKRITPLLRQLDLQGGGIIPECYLQNSPETRIRLLEGMIDGSSRLSKRTARLTFGPGQGKLFVTTNELLNFLGIRHEAKTYRN